MTTRDGAVGREAVRYSETEQEGVQMSSKRLFLVAAIASSVVVGSVPVAHAAGPRRDARRPSKGR
jgi:hypothetical protein